ncbi:MAG: hypothetical protein AAFV07_14580, partial [Bacteroidota bacterium]
LYACASSITYPSATAIYCEASSPQLIERTSDAICFASQQKFVRTSLDSIEQHTMWAQRGWEVQIIEENSADWVVLFRSAGNTIPTYTCKVAFSSKGRVLKNKSGCGFNK